MKKFACSLILCGWAMFSNAQEEVAAQASTAETSSTVSETQVLNEPATAHEEKEETPKGSIAVNLLTNSFAGFHPGVFGNFPLKSGTPITFYAIYWTNPAFGNTDSGTDFWFEHGFGTAFHLFNDALLVNPSLGFTHGKLLTGAPNTRIGDGIVPSVFMLHNGKRFVVDFYLAYYKAMRSSETSKDFLFNWVNPAIKFNDFFAVGAYYEQFVNTRDGDQTTSTSINQWVGGSVKFSTGKGHSVMVAAGGNFSSIGSKEFYKVSTFIPLN